MNDKEKVALAAGAVAAAGIGIYAISKAKAQKTSTASTGTLEVYVTGMTGSPEYGVPLNGATVTVDSQSCTTDSNGYCSLSLSAGTYTVSVSAKGYQSESQSVTITAGQTTTIVFNLQPSTTPTSSQPLSVTISVQAVS